MTYAKDLPRHTPKGDKFSDHLQFCETILETTPAPFVLKDTDCVYLFVNRAFCRLVGKSQREITGKTDHHLFPAGEADQYVADDKAVMAGGEQQKEVWEVPCAGGLQWLKVLKTAVVDDTGECTGILWSVTDVTDVVESDENTWMKSILGVIGENNWDWDIKAGEVRFSPQWIESLGYEQNEVPARIESWEKLIHPEDAPRVFEALQEHFTGRTPVYQCENRLRKKSGEYRWNLDRGKVIEWDENGKPARMVGCDLDISEQKATENALRESEHRLNIHLQNTPVGAISWDLDFRVTDWNPAAETIFGYSRSEAMGKRAHELILCEDVKEEVDDIFRDLLSEKGGALSTNDNMTRDGRRITCEWYNTAIKDDRGRVVSMASLVNDATERKRIEEELKRQNGLITSLFDSIPDIIFLKDAEGVYLGCNPPFADFVGKSKKKIIGKTDYDLFDKETADFFRNHDKRMFERCETRHNEEWITYPDGRKILIDTLKTPYLRQDGELLGIIGISRDITELYNHRLHLENLVEDRTTELNRANAELTKANRLKDEFLANMSHELRTPLTSILGMSEALIEQVYGPLNEKQLGSLKHLNSSGDHLLNLINDILDLSKMDAGKMELEMETVSVEALCRSSLQMIQEMADKKELKVNLSHDISVDHFRADTLRIKQILVNLLMNAVKFTPEGGKVGLDVNCDPHRNKIEFTVWDTGIGIPDEDIDKLFTPFVQLDGSFTRAHKGTGLGLALVYKLTELHGGSVTVVSEAGKYSRFTVALPAGEAFESAGSDIRSFGQAFEVPKPSKVLPQRRTRILMADDNMANIETVADYLEAKSYDVLLAYDGSEALRLAAEKNPGLILMDIQMPVMDGLSAIKAIRNWKDPENPEAESEIRTIPIIALTALTALAMPGDREKCLEAGADEYMSKPVGLKKLIETIEGLIKN